MFPIKSSSTTYELLILIPTFEHEVNVTSPNEVLINGASEELVSARVTWFRFMIAIGMEIAKLILELNLVCFFFCLIAIETRGIRVAH